LKFGINDQYCTEKPGEEGQKKIPVQVQKNFCISIDKAENWKRET